MRRPRSLPGLLLHLGMLYARRRPLWAMALAAVLVAAIAWPRHRAGDRATEDQAAGGGVRAAVLSDGFVLSHPDGGGRRVVELAPDGTERSATVVRHADDQRIVGGRRGALVAWQEGKKVRLARVDDDRDATTWGKSVRQLCDGVASNDARFAIGWLESDDVVWIVHGPVAESAAGAAGNPTAEALELRMPAPEAVRHDWCGVASADENIALLWRTGDKLKFGMCTKRRCSSLIATVKLERQLPVLGVGCVSNACLIGIRDVAGEARVAFVTETGKVKWSKPLEASSDALAILGIGDRSLVVGRLAAGGAEILRFDRTGNATSVWRDPAATSVPALAWSNGRLLIARHHGSALVREILPLAR